MRTKIAQGDTLPVAAPPSPSPVPEVQVTPQPAAGKKGPVGTAPRTNYSKVNTGTPPAPDAGAAEQKSLLPKYGSKNMQTAPHTSLQDMMKAAMDGALSRTEIAREAERQASHTDVGEKTAAAKPAVKTASAASLSSDYIGKVAAALRYVAEEIEKDASTAANISENHQEPGKGPGALAVSQATASTSLPDHKGQATQTVPMSTGTERGEPKTAPSTALETNDKTPAGAGGKTPEKVAEANLEIATKIAMGGAAPASLFEANLEVLGIKLAEDAINPAQISAGKAEPPQTSAAGEAGGEPAGGAPQGPTGLLGSNEAAINYTRGQAYANRKADMKKWLDEPMMTSGTDKTLQVALSHTGEAGPKVASAPAGGEKTAAARAMLEKLMNEVE